MYLPSVFVPRGHLFITVSDLREKNCTLKHEMRSPIVHSHHTQLYVLFLY